MPLRQVYFIFYPKTIILSTVTDFQRSVIDLSRKMTKVFTPKRCKIKFCLYPRFWIELGNVETLPGSKCNLGLRFPNFLNWGQYFNRQEVIENMQGTTIKS